MFYVFIDILTIWRHTHHIIPEFYISTDYINYNKTYVSELWRNLLYLRWLFYQIHFLKIFSIYKGFLIYNFASNKFCTEESSWIMCWKYSMVPSFYKDSILIWKNFGLQSFFNQKLIHCNTIVKIGPYRCFTSDSLMRMPFFRKIMIGIHEKSRVNFKRPNITMRKKRFLIQK